MNNGIVFHHAIGERTNEDRDKNSIHNIDNKNSLGNIMTDFCVNKSQSTYKHI